jgi:hypothetical protein
MKESLSYPSKKSLQLLGGLSLVLAIVLIQQARMGTVSMEYAIVAISLLARMALFPALLVILIVRSPQFQSLEKRCF